MNENLVVLQERHNWLAARITAKRSVGWETQWDEREHRALAWAIEQLKQAEAEHNARAVERTR
jgi:hypothetical protein